VQEYTVVGYFTDNNQPWMEPAQAKDPMHAAVLAVRALLKRNEWSEENADNLMVVEVIDHTCKGVLENEETLSGTTILAILMEGYVNSMKEWNLRAQIEDLRRDYR
jgi:hypothetical protein